MWCIFETGTHHSPANERDIIQADARQEQTGSDIRDVVHDSSHYYSLLSSETKAFMGGGVGLETVFSCCKDSPVQTLGW